MQKNQNMSGRLKPVIGKLDLETTVSYVDDDRGQVIRKQILHTSSKVPESAPLAIGLMKDNALHITPLSKGVLQMRPTTSALSLSKAASTTTQSMETEVMDASLSDDGDSPTKKGREVSGEGDVQPQQIMLKRKESERAQASRLQSYSYYLSVLEAEPSRPLRIHSPDDDATQAQFDGLYATAAENMLSSS